MITRILVYILFINQVYTVLCASTLDTEWIIVEDEDGNLEIVETNATPEDSASTLAELEEAVRFYLFTSSNPGEAQRIYIDNMLEDIRLSDTNFNGSYPTRIIIHGWQNTMESSINTLIRDAHLNSGPYNVIVVDWSKYANRNYITARRKVLTVGEYVGLFINCLEKIGVNPKDLTVIGHSLGAHVAGVACRTSKHEVGIIIALDPAGPLFYLGVQHARLRSTDATFVQVTHTSAGTLGHMWSLGDVDIWVNSGSSQPGCSALDMTCSHGRAFIYYVESILYPERKYTTRSCYYFIRLLGMGIGFCSSNNLSHLGGLSTDTTVTGNYYVDTNSASYYAKG